MIPQTALSGKMLKRKMIKQIITLQFYSHEKRESYSGYSPGTDRHHIFIG
jgi:hypothetical protein